MYSQDAAKQKLKEMFVHDLHCVHWDGPYILASGKVSDYKIDLDIAFENKESRNLLGLMGYETILELEKKEGKPLDIVGIMNGGYKWAESIAEISGRDIFGVDPHTGKTKGVIDNKPVFLDDVVTTGGSIIKGKRISGYSGSAYAYGIVLREDNAIETLRKNGLEAGCYLSLEDVL